MGINNNGRRVSEDRSGGGRGGGGGGLVQDRVKGQVPAFESRPGPRLSKPKFLLVLYPGKCQVSTSHIRPRPTATHTLLFTSLINNTGNAHVLVSSKTFVCNLFHSRKTCARCHKKCTYVFMYSTVILD